MTLPAYGPAFNNQDATLSRPRLLQRPKTATNQQRRDAATLDGTVSALPSNGPPSTTSRRDAAPPTLPKTRVSPVGHVSSEGPRPMVRVEPGIEGPRKAGRPNKITSSWVGAGRPIDPSPSTSPALKTRRDAVSAAPSIKTCRCSQQRPLHQSARKRRTPNRSSENRPPSSSFPSATPWLMATPRPRPERQRGNTYFNRPNWDPSKLNENPSFNVIGTIKNKSILSFLINWND